MLRTVFYIPNEIAGWPVFGVGLLLFVWAVGSVALLGWMIYRRGFDAETRGYVPLLLLVGATIWLLLPRVATPFGLPIRGYGTMLLIATGLACGLAIYRARQMHVDPEIIFSLTFWLFVAGIVGARTFYVVQYFDTFRGDTLGATIGNVLNITEGGLVNFGGVIGGSLALAIFFRVRYLPALAMCDLIAPSVALALCFGRIGCFLNGCCFGGVSDVPWAVRFPQNSPPYEYQVIHGQAFVSGLKFDGGDAAGAVISDVQPDSPAAERGLRAGQRVVTINGRAVANAAQARRVLLGELHRSATIAIETGDDPQPSRWDTSSVTATSLPIHPTQLYSAINGLVLCAFLWAYYPFRRRDGEVVTLLAGMYAVTRFIIEIIRTDEQAIAHTGLTISQNVSLVLLFGAVVAWMYLRSRPRGSALPAALAPA